MITYGNGEVIGLENIQGFDIKYKGSIEIDPAQDNWIIQANKNRIIGICLNKTSSALLFTYTGELRILSAKYVQNNEQHRSRITLQGVDFWGLDREKWEDDGSLWGTRDGTYLVGSKKRKTTIKNLENGVSKVPVHDTPSQSLPNHIVLTPQLVNTYSLDFDGSNDYVALSSETNISGDWSFSAWVAPSATTYEGILASKSSSNTMITIQSSTNLRVRLHQPSSSYRTISWDTGLTAIPTDGSWTHIAITKSGTTLTPYYNGIKGNTGTLNGSDGILKAQMLGGSNADNTFENKFAGNMDEVAIWDTLLDDDAVTAIYNSGTPTDLSSDSGDYDNSSNLQGYWRMGDGTLDTYPLIADQTNATLGSNLQDTTFNNSDLLGFTGATATGFTAVNANSAVGANDNAYGKALSLTAGDTYKLSWTTTINSYDLVQQLDVAVATSVGGGSGDTTTAGTHTASGDYVNYFQVASTNTYYIAFRLGGNREYDFTISNVSLQKVNGNPGLMTNMVSGDIEEDTP